MIALGFLISVRINYRICHNKNSSHIHITGQQQISDGWEFTWQFVGGNMGGTFDVNNDGSITANASGGDNVGTGNWK